MSATTTNDRPTFEAIQRDKDTAAGLTTVCPQCGAAAKVLAQHHQATRTQPCQFLGFEGFCVSCQLGGITVDAPKCDCLECGEPITGDVAEFEGYPFRTFCMDCMAELGSARALLLARTAPESAWSDVTGC